MLSSVLARARPLDHSEPLFRTVLSLLWLGVFGWWLGLLAILLTWLLHLSLVGLPLGVWLGNRLSNVFMLVRRPAGAKLPLPQDERTPLAGRIAYFLLIGSWLGLVWLLFAWSFTAGFALVPLTLWLRFGHPALFLLTAPVGLALAPIGLWMLNRAEAVAILQTA